MEDAPPSSRRARRDARRAGASAGTETPAGADDAAEFFAASAGPVDEASVGEGRPVALGWLEDSAIGVRPAPTGLADATHPYAAVSVDLLAQRPRRSPLRPGVVLPFLTALAVVGAYAATTLLWPLYAVTPVVEQVEVADVAAPATAVAWPAAGSAAIGVAGFDGAVASSTDRVPIASIAKVVTSLMILDEMPLAPGESGPTFAFTARDRQTYYNYLEDDESALNVPVGGSLTQYQMLQGILIGSAGNYADRLASTIWPTDDVFASAATAWLARKDLSGITLVEPTGIDTDDAADPASLIRLARLAMADPVIAEIVRTPSVTLPGAGEVVNTNDLLATPGVVGIKTGSLSRAYNLLAAKELTVGDTTVRAYATALGQPSDEARDTETARLLDAVLAEVSQPRILPAGTVVGTVTAPWGATTQIVTDADASLLLWNGAASPVTSDLSLGDARDAGDAVGTVSMKGPLGDASTGAHLAGDIPDPDPWWRLTHPLQLFGLID